MEAQRQVGGGSLLLICHLSPFSSLSFTASSGKPSLGLYLGSRIDFVCSALGGNALWTQFVLLEVLRKLCAGLVCPLHIVGA